MTGGGFGRMIVYALILAAGKGTRLGSAENKVFRAVGGRSILERSVDVFVKCSNIDHIVIVADQDEINRVKCLMEESYPGESIHVVKGGASRQESALSGLLAIERLFESPASSVSVRRIVLIHDAARCFLPRELVTELIDTIRNHYAGVAPAIAVTDTIRLTDERGESIEQTLPRRRLVAMQTPQGADFDVMLKAALVAKEEGALVTDDLELLMRIGYPVRLVKGDDRNLKITTPGDLIIAESIISDEMEI